MTPRVELLKADVRDELAKIARLSDDFGRVEPMLDRSADEVPFYDRAAIGYYLHAFYNGCESIFRTIARFFENSLPPERWHAELLRRMRLAVPGYRPAVIDEPLYRALDDFRAFRHVYRNTYAFELDWERERLVARKFRPTAARLREQVEAFLARLDELEAE